MNNKDNEFVRVKFWPDWVVKCLCTSHIINSSLYILMVSNLSHIPNQNYNSPLQNVPVYIVYDTPEKNEPLDFTCTTTSIPLYCCALFSLSILLFFAFLSCLLHLSNAVDCWAHFKIWLNRQEKWVVAKAQLPQLYLFQWDYFRPCLAEPYGLTHYCFGALAVLPDHVF